jgi:hypothetical protein
MLVMSNYEMIIKVFADCLKGQSQNTTKIRHYIENSKLFTSFTTHAYTVPKAFFDWELLPNM